MAALPDEIKLFIVNALACYDAPTVVADAVKEEFGVVVSRQQVSCYDPNTYVGRNLSKKWRDVFAETRARFREKADDIPIASKSYRLRLLSRMVTKAESMRNFALVAQLLEQASKEVGGAFTNRRELTGKDGGPIGIASAKDMTDDQLAAIAGRSSPGTADST